MEDCQFERSRYDALIVGARCAGAATAMLLARAGAKVLVIDRQQYGADTVSTHALMRGGVLQLKRWGVLPRLMAEGTPAITQTTFHYGQDQVRIDISADHGVTYLCAPRRNVLDRLLVDAAREAGAEVRHGVSLAELHHGADGRVAGAVVRDADGAVAPVRADIVIGADGRQSTLARLAGAQIYREGAASSGYVYGYFEGMPDDGTHWYFDVGVTAGAIPTNQGRHCVFAGVTRDRFAATFRKNLEGGFLKVAAANSPALRDDIARARPVGRFRGFVSDPGYFRRSHGPGWALVGDAGYFKDPLTAHGMTDAFRDAELLAQAVAAGGARALARYQDERDALSRDLFDVTDAIASFQWNLDEIKAYHGRLSNAMKAETDHIAGFATERALAA